MEDDENEDRVLTEEALRRKVIGLISKNKSSEVMKLVENQNFCPIHTFINKSVFLLHEAVYSNNISVVENLLGIKGVKVNLVGTPLIIAVEKRNPTTEIVKVLLENNADIFARNLKGKTSLEVVKNEKIKDFLVDHMIKYVLPQRLDVISIDVQYQDIINKEKKRLELIEEYEGNLVSTFYKTNSQELNEKIGRQTIILLGNIMKKIRVVRKISELLENEEVEKKLEGLVEKERHLNKIKKDTDHYVIVMYNMDIIDKILKRISREFSFIELQGEIDLVIQMHNQKRRLNREVENDYKHNNLDNAGRIKELHDLSSSLEKMVEKVRRKIREKLKELQLQYKSFDQIYEQKIFTEKELDDVTRFIEITIKKKKDYLEKRRNELIQIKTQNKIYYRKIFDIKKGGIFDRKKYVMTYFGESTWDGLKHGKGKEYYEDGVSVKFEGKFDFDERAGFGTEYDQHGNAIRAGEWEDTILLRKKK